jgi:hypothetical protein
MSLKVEASWATSSRPRTGIWLERSVSEMERAVLVKAATGRTTLSASRQARSEPSRSEADNPGGTNGRVWFGLGPVAENRRDEDAGGLSSRTNRFAQVLHSPLGGLTRPRSGSRMLPQRATSSGSVSRRY